MRNDLKDEAVYSQERLDQYIWEGSKVTGLSRRRFIQLAAAGVGAVALSGLPVAGVPRRVYATHTGPVVKPVPPDLFYDYGGISRCALR